MVARRTEATASLAIFWTNRSDETAGSGPSSLWVRKDGFLCTSSYATLTLQPSAPQQPHNHYDLERIAVDTDESLRAQSCHTRAPG